MNQTLAEITSQRQQPITAKDGEGQPLPFYNPRPVPLRLRMLHCFDYSLSLTLSYPQSSPPSHPLLSLSRKCNQLFAIFDVLTAVFMDIQVLCDMTPCRLVNSYLHLQGQTVQQHLSDPWP